MWTTVLYSRFVLLFILNLATILGYSYQVSSISNQCFFSFCADKRAQMRTDAPENETDNNNFGIPSVEQLITNRHNRFLNRYRCQENYLCQALA